MIIKYYWFLLKAKYKKYLFFQNAKIGEGFRCTYDSSCVNLSENIENITIGNNCEICGTLIVDETGFIKVGEYTTIRYGTSVESTNRIIIGDHVIISNNVVIRDNNSHPIDNQKRIELCESGFESDLWKWKYAKSAPINIEKNVWIGERAIIYKGVTIGEGSIVAGGSVVTKSVPPYSIVAGNPAVIVKKISK